MITLTCNPFSITGKIAKEKDGLNIRISTETFQMLMRKNPFQTVDDSIISMEEKVPKKRSFENQNSTQMKPWNVSNVDGEDVQTVNDSIGSNLNETTSKVIYRNSWNLIRSYWKCSFVGSSSVMYRNSTNSYGHYKIFKSTVENNNSKEASLGFADARICRCSFFCWVNIGHVPK